MSATERNRYVSPLHPRESSSAPSNASPAGTFGTAPRFWAASQPIRSARSPSWSHTLGSKGTAAANPVRRGGYAELAQARSNQAQSGAPAQRSKTPAAPRPSSVAAAAYFVPRRRATTPQAYATLHFPTRLPTTGGTGGPSRGTVPADPGSAPGRQSATPSREARGLASDRTMTPRTPRHTLPGPGRGAARSPPHQDSCDRRYTAPNPNSPFLARRLTYADSPFATSRGTYLAAATTTGRSVSPAGGLPSAVSAVRSVGVGGRFQEPGDDWLSSYEKSSMGLLQELERVLGGFTRRGPPAPSPTEAGAPPRPLPTAAERRLAGASGAPAQVQSHRPVESSPGTGGSSSGAAIGNAAQSAWGALQATEGSDIPSRRTAWSEASQAFGLVQGQAAPPVKQLAVGLAYSYLRPGAGSPAANAANIVPLASPTQGSDCYPSGPGAAKGRRQEESGTAAQQPPAAGPPPLQAPTHLHGASAGSAGQAAQAAAPSGTISELYSMLQACSSTTTRLMADLAAARREVELANARAEEADSLARTFQQQLIERQKGVAQWQKALLEMEEREATARQELAEAQERCSEQALRARQAEHVAAMVQLRLERLMQEPGLGAGGGSRRSGTVEEPDLKLQQQLEQVQADLAAAKTRATRVELELAVARNKALIAQQELSAEEERARRATATAAAARTELGRTRSALEMMGRDHDRLQSQLEEVRSKIGDIAPQRHGSSRPDLLAPADQGSASAAPRAAPPQQGAATPPPPPPVRGTGASPAGPSSRLPASGSSATAGGATAAGGPLTAAGRVPRTAAPSSTGEQPRHQLLHLGIRGAVGGPSGDSNAGCGRNDDGTHKLPAGAAGLAQINGDETDDAAAAVASSARRLEGAISPVRRRRRGSLLLLLPPGEVPADTSASVRYRHRMVLRRQSRSQDLGLAESPHGGGGGFSPGVLMASRSMPGGVQSPRNLSGSHDGVMRRLNLSSGSGDYGSTTEEDLPDEARGGGAGRRDLRRGGSESDDGVSPREAGANGAAEARRSVAGGAAVTLFGSGVMTEEMLPLSRTPSGARRRIPSLQISLLSSREAPQPTRALLPLPPSEGMSAAAAAAAVQKASPATSVPGPEAARMERMPSGRSRGLQPAAAVPERVPQGAAAELLAAAEPCGISGIPSVGAQQAQQLDQQQPGQQQRGDRQDGMHVSLADLRRQMAAATAAATATATAAGTPDVSPAAPRPWTATATPGTQVQKALPSAAPAGNARRPALQQSPRRQSSPPLLAPLQQLPGHHQGRSAPMSSRALPPAATSPAGGVAAGRLRQVRSDLPELLPPLEQSSSPPGSARDAAAPNSTLSRSPLATPRGSTAHQDPHTTAAVAAPAAQRGGGAAVGATTAAAAGSPMAAAAPFRAPAAAVGAVPSQLRALTVDTSPPQGFNTSHLNDLFESTRWSLRFNTAPLPPPAGPPRVPAPPLQPTVHGPPEPPPAQQPEASHRRDQAGATAAVTEGAAVRLPGAGSCHGVQSGTFPTDVSRVDGPHLALTPRSRMLSPSQLDSFLVSPSVTNSMAAVASIDGPPASGAAKQWQQQQRQLAPSPLRGAAAGEQRPLAPSQPVESSAAGPAGQPVTGAAAAVAALHADGRGGRATGMASVLAPCASGMSAAASGASTADSGSGQSRRPWWRHLLPPRRRGAEVRGATAANPEEARAEDARASSLSARSPAGGSPSRLQPSARPEAAAPSPRALVRELADRMVHRPSSIGASAPRTAAAGVHGPPAALGPVSPAGSKSSPRRKGGGTGGGGGGLVRSMLLHLCMWSGGMAVGALLVLGVAGIVEGTFGLGAATGPPPGGDAGVTVCRCPPAGPCRRASGVEKGAKDRSEIEAVQLQ